MSVAAHGGGRRPGDDRAVVVTGLGATTPVGGDMMSTWDSMLVGRSGVRAIGEPWARGRDVRIAAPAAADPAASLPRTEARRLDRCQRLALVAAREAWQDAGAPDVPPERVGVAFSSGCGGLLTLLDHYGEFLAGRSAALPPHGVTMFMANGPAVVVGLDVRAGAGVHAPVSACASSAEAVAVAARMIRDGRADVVLAGGAEAVIHPLTLAAFEAMRALSRRNDAPQRASRPFDRDRDGFVLGEGAAALVLEERGHAAARGAPQYAELAGVGVSSDAHDRVRPDPSGAGAARAIRAALDDAGASARDVAHVCAHATSTPLGDLAEAAAIRSALGAAAGLVAVSAPKSTVGHLLGAAGALGAAATVLSVHHRVVPPTANLAEQDDRIGLDVVADSARRLPADAVTALTHSFGFGGHNVVLAFRSVGGRPHGEAPESPDTT